MKKNLLITLTVLVAALTSFSCSSTKNSSIYNSKWELDEVNGVIIDYLVDPSRDIYLTFDEGKSRFGGSTGCNTIGGKLFVEGEKLILSNMIATKMACKNMRAEQSYLSLLESVDNYKLKGARLILYQGTKEIASYRRSKEAAPPITD